MLVYSVVSAMLKLIFYQFQQIILYCFYNYNQFQDKLFQNNQYYDILVEAPINQETNRIRINNYRYQISIKYKSRYCKHLRSNKKLKSQEKHQPLWYINKQKQEIQNQGSSRTTDRTKTIENSLVGEASMKPEKLNYVMKEQQKFQPQIDMRKGFAGRYDKKGEWEHYLPPLPSVQERENKQLKQLVKFTKKFVDKVPKLKLRQRLKSCFIAIKALVRWAKLVKSLIQKKRLNTFFYSNCLKEVIYNDQIKAIKFKQWTQMAFSKVFNQIKKERLEQYYNLNIIDGPCKQLSPQENDICVLKLRYLIQLMLEGFLVMTNKPNLLKELVGEILKELFLFIYQFKDYVFIKQKR
ncbi:unnamed protein product [Paramecium octaurelia]|uniref:Uncharacterized protein n=1 Tax=Paramecium octaurelia TaxID=43137 RepID=A0A8S1WBK3_PAROT|nr:unnamed protein product [Paramecium octaurelia]